MMVGQLGLSLLMPLLICLFLSYLAVTKLSVGAWIYLPGFVLGLGGSFATAWKVYLSIVKKQENQGERRRKEVTFNRHF